MQRLDIKFSKEIGSYDKFNAEQCFNCGTCTALCPMEINILPRILFRYVLMGMKDKLMENKDAIYSCLLCRMCEDNCPEGVRIAENIRVLRRYIGRHVYGL
ncbi:MAG: 4Fe-4S dicluster domain-containing protein [Dissulfurimicrobium hydrothermale]|uniref:4Fe-4S dicluster domain-containing protein n=1 Tax=Dissulfurimicrobium hydrothermale TaxID=1750598 RepID=UPI003C71C923